ncbi:MAG: nucleotidyl transferase AbiEii/AbiGii toxin family protein [Candidatus Roizmanbacteria bacterium]|nr:nucleotidyl transferase AbiEii/AbiGii toxin family protein [Candidatus Roizmanbacteria bacterium]
MILSYIQKIIQEQQDKGVNPLYIRSSIKEYLQIIVLDYIYRTNEYKSSLIFTGGTCLRHLFGIDRLSEDLDFDTIKSVSSEDFPEKIAGYFKSMLKYPDVNISIKQQGKQILLKFPILREVGISGPNESEMLYVKIDLSPKVGKSYNIIKTSKSEFGYNFVALHYDLPSLFAGKISAILSRNLLTGMENRQTIKGRDFYDLLWYLKRGSPLNFNYLKEKIGIPNMTLKQLNELVEDKVNIACTLLKNDFKNDLLPFIRNQDFIADYVDNYLDEYKRYKIHVSNL